MVTRREFVKGGAAALALPGLGGCLTGGAVGSAYTGWRPGELDIHFIHTGVGEQTFFIFPDGTTMLLDCGDTHHAKYMKDVPPMPDASRYGGEWVSRYIQRLIPQREIDYAMVSHWHGDHCGDLMFGGKKMPDGRSAGFRSSERTSVFVITSTISIRRWPNMRLIPIRMRSD